VFGLKEQSAKSENFITITVLGIILRATFYLFIIYLVLIVIKFWVTQDLNKKLKK
jgi:hypothetical protein